MPITNLYELRAEVLDIRAPDEALLRQNLVSKTIKESIKNVRVINDDKCTPRSHSGNKHSNVADIMEIAK